MTAIAERLALCGSTTAEEKFLTLCHHFAFDVANLATAANHQWTILNRDDFQSPIHLNGIIHGTAQVSRGILEFGLLMCAIAEGRILCCSATAEGSSTGGLILTVDRHLGMQIERAIGHDGNAVLLWFNPKLRFSFYFAGECP